MVFFHQSKECSVEFRVVYAFPTDEKVQKDFGIFYNFSVKTIMHIKGNEIPLMAINGLTITTTRNGVEYISSISTRVKQVDRVTGQQVLGRRIDSVTMFPGHHNNDAESDRYDLFMTELLKEIDEFIQNKRNEVGDRSYPVSERLMNMTTRTAGNKKELQPSPDEDIPF